MKLNLYTGGPTAVFSGADQPIALFQDSSSQDRDSYDNMAEIFAIFAVVEELEKAYARDMLGADDYCQLCHKLILQYRTALACLGPSFDIHHFISTYHIACPAAYRRLVEVGVPATQEHSSGQNRPFGSMGHQSIPTNHPVHLPIGQQNQAIPSAVPSSSVPATATINGVYIAKVVELFITAMDSLKLGVQTVSELHPILSDLLDALNRTGLSSNNSNSSSGKDKNSTESEPREIVLAWLIKLNQMRAYEELSMEDSKQMAFELEKGLNAFYRMLKQ